MTTVVHYAGVQKPWNNSRMKYASEFWKIVPYTDFTDEIKQIHDNYQRDMKIMKNSDKNAAKINKYVRRKMKLVYILLGVLIGLNIAGLVVFARRKK
jgi:lipopolysaccharide biosynthesis glycosyltransferase